MPLAPTDSARSSVAPLQGGLFLNAGVMAGVFLFLLFGPAALQAQTVGIEYGATQADYDGALDRPHGVSGHFDLPLGDHLAVRLAIMHHTEDMVITRSPCVGLVPPGQNCTPETFDGSGALTTYGAGLVVPFAPLVAWLQPALYGLVIGADVEANFISRRDGDRIGPVTPEGLSIGVAFGGSLRVPLTDALALTGRVGVQVPRFQACGADAWFAFCGQRTLWQVALGTQVRLAALRF